MGWTHPFSPGHFPIDPRLGMWTNNKKSKHINISHQFYPASVLLLIMLGSTLLLAVTCLLINSAGSQKIRTVACEGSETQLKCDKGQLISVSRATYGRSDQKTCSSGRPVQQTTNVQCSGNADKVAQSCNGKQSCSIQAANSVFGDPCVGTYKYLEVEYTCKAPESSSQEDGPTVACEGSMARLQCDKGQLISVSRATYGRSDQKTCSSGRPANQLTNVQCPRTRINTPLRHVIWRMPKVRKHYFYGHLARRTEITPLSAGSRSKKIVAKSCNGKQSCSIQAANSVFGDPCVGTYKYLEVEYTCKAPESSSQEEGPTVACEGSVARLQCDKGQLISVSRATYGRSDQKTCSSGRPANQLTNVQCSGNADKVAQRCNGRRKCRVRAANSMFGDPCVGTYKYLEVDYLCYASVTG